MPYQPPTASLNRLGTIVDKIALAKPIGKDITKRPKIFATLPSVSSSTQRPSQIAELDRADRLARRSGW
jgi:hypothetical protein